MKMNGYEITHNVLNEANSKSLLGPGKVRNLVKHIRKGWRYGVDKFMPHKRGWTGEKNPHTRVKW